MKKASWEYDLEDKDGPFELHYDDNDEWEDEDYDYDREIYDQLMDNINEEIEADILNNLMKKNLDQDLNIRNLDLIPNSSRLRQELAKEYDSREEYRDEDFENPPLPPEDEWEDVDDFDDDYDPDKDHEE